MKTPASGLLAFLLFSSAASTGAQAASPEKARTIRWTVAHSRGESEYNDLMKEFASRLERKSDGKLKVKFTDSGGDEDAAASAARQQVLNGGADLSQLDTNTLFLSAVQMPYVFRSHEHAEAVFDGPIGAKLLGSVSASSDGKLRGMAFTYSGGYRILIGKVPVRKAGDLKGLRIKRASAIVADFAKELGAETASGPENKIDLYEVELSRIHTRLEASKRAKFANLTRHRMLVTAVVANEKFLASLTDKQQRLLADEIQNLAVAERKLSVALEERNLQLLTKNGVEIVEVPVAELRAFEKAGEAVCDKFPELAEQIKDVRSVKDKSSGRLAAAYGAP